MAQAIDKPALRHNLHPGANAGGAGTEPHQTEITIVKCFEYPAKGRSLHVLGVCRPDSIFAWPTLPGAANPPTPGRRTDSRITSQFADGSPAIVLAQVLLFLPA